MLIALDNKPQPINWEARDWMERTVQNAKNLLMTRQGEVPFDRYRGLDTALFHLPVTEAKKVIQQEAERLMLWEPDVQVTESSIDASDGFLIELTLEIDMEQNA